MQTLGPLASLPACWYTGGTVSAAKRHVKCSSSFHSALIRSEKVPNRRLEVCRRFIIHNCAARLHPGAVFADSFDSSFILSLCRPAPFAPLCVLRVFAFPLPTLPIPHLQSHTRPASSQSSAPTRKRSEITAPVRQCAPRLLTPIPTFAFIFSLYQPGQAFWLFLPTLQPL